MKALYLVGAVLLLASPTVSAGDRDSLDVALDEFAAAHFDKIQPRSIAEGVEYCGLFGLDAAGNLAATKAKRGRADSCQPDDEPDGFEVLASYHTHGSYDRDADTEVPSVDDLAGDIEEEIDGYIATPGGRLWLNDFEEQVSYQLCGPGCMRMDPRFRECKAYPPADEYTLETLQARADNDTGDC